MSPRVKEALEYIDGQEEDYRNAIKSWRSVTVDNCYPEYTYSPAVFDTIRRALKDYKGF